MTLNYDPKAQAARVLQLQARERAAFIRAVRPAAVDLSAELDLVGVMLASLAAVAVALFLF